MAQELVRYPDRSLYEIYPWDWDCLVRAVLYQTGTVPYYITIIKGDKYFAAVFRDQSLLHLLQHQHKKIMEIEIIPQHLHLMNLEKIYPQLQVSLSIEMVHLAKLRMIIPFQLQVSETRVETSISALRYCHIHKNRVKCNSGSPLSCPPTPEHFPPASS